MKKALFIIFAIACLYLIIYLINLRTDTINQQAEVYEACIIKEYHLTPYACEQVTGKWCKCNQ